MKSEGSTMMWLAGGEWRVVLHGAPALNTKGLRSLFLALNLSRVLFCTSVSCFQAVVAMAVTNYQRLVVDTEGLKSLPESCTQDGCYRVIRLSSVSGPPSPSTRRRALLSVLGSGFGIPVRSILETLQKATTSTSSLEEKRRWLGGGGEHEWEMQEGDVFLHTPNVFQLSQLFPSTFYFPVRLNEDFPTFSIDVEQMHIFPTSLSTYKCSSTQFRIFTQRGLADLATALSRPSIERNGKTYKPLAAALAARRPWYIESEQDPTVVLHQWWKEDDNGHRQEIWTETPLLWAFPDLVRSDPKDQNGCAIKKLLSCRSLGDSESVGGG